MKTVEELREMLKGIFDEKTSMLASLAISDCSHEMDAETQGIHDAVMKGLDGLVRQSLNVDVRYAVPDDDFYDDLRKLMAHQLYAVYQTYTVAENVTDEQILAHRSAIEARDIPALEDLRKMPPDKNFTAPIGTAFNERKRMYNNLNYYLYVMAHVAKRYDARLAAQNFLRAGSIARHRMQCVPRIPDESTIEELISLIQDGVDELKIAADYCALQGWDDFRTAQAANLAAEDACLAAENAKGKTA